MKSYWINLPVADVKASTEFFRNIGFEINEERSNDDTLAGIMVGKQVICLFRKDVLEGFMGRESRRRSDYPETIISFDMESDEAVDELARLIEQNGGKVLSPPGKKNGYYGIMFSDLDDHLFNVIVM
ncbi:extradiol dioxygenase [Macrococcus epidermidis]|uniref:Extradiol dioxygenase n=1 Tax=Macrococcus epidermidis TaxID=1902580 RepID=A0A327ZWL0_9STAP|nr:VOC family protein [Macrococcus epidermidis]MCG7419988.1 extradiol dioxygenase [Macrococcus epidermidis]RAK46612.1 extradiol dioxygenase [Macrococcus epidermidis]UTH14989.1 extradiol dioxygenase [Macrococcus epidermidis]